MLGNALASHAFQSFRVMAEDECPVPTHRALAATLKLAQTRQPVLKLRKVTEMSFSTNKDKQVEAAEAAKHLQPIIESQQKDWDLACQWGNTDWAMDILSHMSEQYLASRSTGTTWVHPSHRGHGEISLRKDLTQAPAVHDAGECAAST